jgi:hypothetical protein
VKVNLDEMIQNIKMIIMSTYKIFEPNLEMMKTMQWARVA